MNIFNNGKPENADLMPPKGRVLCPFTGALAQSAFGETLLVEGGTNHEKENHTHLSDDCPWGSWNDLRSRCYSRRENATSSS